jgi:hypothetical protein
MVSISSAKCSSFWASAKTQLDLLSFGKAEGEKKGCYPFSDGFRQPTPALIEPTGDDKSPVSMRL